MDSLRDFYLKVAFVVFVRFRTQNSRPLSRVGCYGFLRKGFYNSFGVWVFASLVYLFKHPFDAHFLACH